MKDKFILDVTCGARGIWFNKNHPNTIYLDIRKRKKGFVHERTNYEIKPDQVMDFRKLEFPDKSFKMVIFDPPHLKGIKENSWIGKKYGSLNSESWKYDIRKGFDECWRVLEDFGVLIFKWSVTNDGRKGRNISLKEVLEISPEQKIVGHTSGTKSNTFWISFMKIPGQELQKKL